MLKVKQQIKIRRKKIYSTLGLWYGLKYSIAYHLHTHCYIPSIGKRPVRLRLKKGKGSLYVRLFSRDLDFFETIYIGEYKSNLGQCIGEYDFAYKDEFDTILDLGANIGLFSILYAIKNPGKKIIAIEPEKGNFSLLQKNTKKYQNIICLQQGVWYRDAYCKVYPGRVIVPISKTRSEGSFYIGECAETDINGIPAQSIETIIAKYNATNCFIKMDIEGAEQEIFELGDLKWLDNCYLLVTETHGWLFKNDMDTMIINKMQEHGYSLSNLGENKIFRK